MKRREQGNRDEYRKEERKIPVGEEQVHDIGLQKSCIQSRLTSV
jgi:hypothetical protein